MTRRYTLSCPSDLRQITLDVGRYFSMANHPLEVVVDRKKRRKSLSQNAMIHSAHMDAAVRVYEGAGNDMTRQEIWDDLKKRLMPDEGRKAVMLGGKQVGEHQSTKGLSMEGMSEFMNRIEAFVNEYGELLTT